MDQTISALAGSLGLKSDTLRYYERIGLLQPSERTAAGYRLYDGVASERLRFIRGAQRMGLTLKDIKELLDIRDRGQCPCGYTRTVVRRRLDEVRSEVRQLEALKRQLIELDRRNEQCLDATGEEWPCITGMEQGGER